MMREEVCYLKITSTQLENVNTFLKQGTIVFENYNHNRYSLVIHHENNY